MTFALLIAQVPDFWDKVWNNGILAVIFTVFGLGVWKAIIWLRDKVATPVVAAHLELLRTLQEAVPKQSQAVTELKITLEKQTLSLAQIEENSKSTAQNSFQQLAMLQQQITSIGDHHNWAVSAMSELKGAVKEEIKTELRPVIKDEVREQINVVRRGKPLTDQDIQAQS